MGNASFDGKENRLDYYRGKDCIEKLCEKLKERRIKIINYEEKEMIPHDKHVIYVKHVMS